MTKMTRHTDLKRSILWGFAMLIVAVAIPNPGSQRASGAQRSSAATHEVPKFEVDPAWPKIPSGWVMGQVASAACDDQGNIWVLQRPKSVRPGQKTGPPVMVFDQAGNYVKGWGGPGEGYDWPQTEHGIFIDYKGFVWIGGSGNDDQILKFTKDGKFVLQIGHGGRKKTNQDTEDFWEPADVFVYPKTNELFVADGYRNKRVIVLDADTGAFKRMWGAFGNVPTDDPAPSTAGGTADGAGQGRGRGPDLNRVPAKELDPNDQGPQQFNLVHGVKVSNDGLVYVSDRGGKRVQVFTIEGKYITQIWIDRWCETVGQGCGNGQTAASTAFSADPAQRFLYVASRSPARIWIYDRKTLQPLDSFGQPGVAPGEFYVLHHMTTDSKGNLYTSEVEDGKRIQKFVFKGLVRIPAK
jgi:DNA-binding beta-propeller fold protein YncE